MLSGGWPQVKERLYRLHMDKQVHHLWKCRATLVLWHNSCPMGSRSRALFWNPILHMVILRIYVHSQTHILQHMAQSLESKETCSRETCFSWLLIVVHWYKTHGASYAPDSLAPAFKLRWLKSCRSFFMRWKHQVCWPLESWKIEGGRCKNSRMHAQKPCKEVYEQLIQTYPSYNSSPL